jgi:hypothetical protein
MAATTKKDMRLSLRQFAALIERTEAHDKSKLPFFKMAVFGNNRAASPSGQSYRSNANVVTVSGIEADYDGEEIMPEDARDMLAEAGIVAAVYTTPSHSPDAPRWRVFAPFSEELQPGVRERHMARLNGIFGGTLDDASFTRSQSYYGGNVTGRPKVTTFLVDGRYVDAASDLDATAKWKRGREKGPANDNGFDEAAYLDAIATGESYHPSAIALAGKWAADGVPYIEAMQRLRAAFDRVSEEDRDSRWKERVASLPSILIHVYLYAPTTCIVCAVLLRMIEMGIRDKNACHMAAKALYQWNPKDGEAALTVEATISTFSDVNRRDQRGAYIERLDPAGLDASRLVGAPVLDGHRQASARDTIGVVTASPRSRPTLWLLARQSIGMTTRSSSRSPRPTTPRSAFPSPRRSTRRARPASGSTARSDLAGQADS